MDGLERKMDMRERYHITGMSCSACSARVEKVVGALEGVEKVSVNLLTATMEIIYEEGTLAGTDIIAAVEKAGYGAMLINGQEQNKEQEQGEEQNKEQEQEQGKEQEHDNELKKEKDKKGKRQSAQDKMAMKWRLGISVFFLLLLMYVSMYHMYNQWFGLPIPGFVMQNFHGVENAMTLALTQLILLLPILYCNRRFFQNGFKALVRFGPNMDSLIAIGASAAVGYGIFAMFRISYGLGHGVTALVEHYSGELYFETAGMILTLITVGKYLEGRSKSKTGEAIQKLMALSPNTAIVLDKAGREREIPTSKLQKGDIFLVKPGSAVPVDGTILEGCSSVDESAITGESMPVDKRAGDKVISATMNTTGFLKCRADRVGEDTTLSMIIQLVEEAGASKAPIARLADKVAGVFVPVVIGIAILSFVCWILAGQTVEFAVSTAIAVLVISCPCALGLATPVAIMVGTGVGARCGVLIKSGEVLQAAKDIDTVVFDKTGTITEGNLIVMGVYGYHKQIEPTELLSVAAALEKMSEHPVARAVIKEAESWQLTLPKVRDFQAVFGRGVQGVLEEGSFQNMQVFVGNIEYLREHQIPVTKEQEEGAKQLAGQGETTLWVALEEKENKVVLGIIAVADAIKDSSRQAVKALKKLGISVVMLTGDNTVVARAVQERVGIDQVMASLLPQDKERQIQLLRQQGKKVAMVGDGINDAPALAAADVGMAIGAGTDIAMESADIVLMKNDLRSVVDAILLSKAVIRNIRQNLFWAFFYNSIGIPLAAGLFYPILGLRLSPMFGAAAMSLSSLFVVGNALRLRGFRSIVKGSDTKT